jgi:hypothetical protein
MYILVGQVYAIGPFKTLEDAEAYCLKHYRWNGLRTMEILSPNQ